MAAVKDFIAIDGKSWEAVNRDLGSWLTRLAVRLDKIEGRAGSPTFFSDLVMNGFRITDGPTSGTFSSSDFITRAFADATYGAAAIRAALQISGSHPLIQQGSSGASAPIEDTHAARLAVNSPSLYDVGQLFYETDRTVVYIVTTTTGTKEWTYISGTMYAAIGNRPVDLGADDTGFAFVNSDADQNAMFFWTGTEFITVGFLQEVLDAATNTSTTVNAESHRASGGAPVAGFGLNRISELDNAAKTLTTAMLQRVEWVASTAGAESAIYTLQLISAAALTSMLTVNQLGELTLLVDTGAYGVGWNGSNAVPTKNAVYDKIEAVVAAAVALVSDAVYGPVWNGVTTIAPSKNAVYDELELRMPGVLAHVIPLAKLTGGGANGSITVNAYGIVTAYTDPT